MEEDQTEQDNINSSKTPLVKSFRLLLNSSSDFTVRGFGRRVTELGGSFERSRGAYESRSVRVPNTEPGRALVDELLAQFPRNREEGTRLGLTLDVLHLSQDMQSVAHRADRYMIKEEEAQGAAARSLQLFHVQFQAARVAYEVQMAKERKERLEVAPKVLRQAILACVKDARAAGLHDDDISEEFIWLLRNWRTTEVA